MLQEQHSAFNISNWYLSKCKMSGYDRFLQTGSHIKFWTFGIETFHCRPISVVSGKEETQRAMWIPNKLLHSYYQEFPENRLVCLFFSRNFILLSYNQSVCGKVLDRLSGASESGE